MPSFSERVALFRIQNYLATYKPYVAAVTGTYGSDMATVALYAALSRHRHVRMGFDIGKEASMGLFKFLTRSGLHEMTEYEPDTIIGELPLTIPRHLPYIASRLLPRLLVLSHIGHEHIDTFGSHDMVAHEYLAATHALSTDAVVVLNADDKASMELREHIAHPVITYGTSVDADVRLARAHRHAGMVLEITLHGMQYECNFPHLRVREHVEGVLAGLAGAHAMGIDTQVALDAMKQVAPPRGCFSSSVGVSGATIIDDTAHVCPEKVESSLKSFAGIQHTGRKVIVLGDIDNLSHHSVRMHEALGTQAASAGQLLVFIGEHMRHAQSAALKTSNYIDTNHFQTTADAAAWLPGYIRSNDLIYISGGKSMEMGKIVERLK